MRILAINGSPKGKQSNTWRLTSSFIEGITAQEEDAHGQAPTVDALSVGALDIKPCRGCFSCWSKTPGKCCIHDDMQEIIEKILRADVVIWSFPLYYFGLPGPLKNLIDRQLPMALPFMSAEAENGGHPSRYDMSGKRTVVISTCGFYTAKGNYSCVSDLFDRLCGKGGYTALFCGQGELFRVNELAERTDEYLSWVRKAGEEFASSAISEETRGKLDQNLFPRDVFEAMADASWGVSKSGEKEDPSLVFTRQMAALYRRQAWPGRDVVLDMNYTDIRKTYRIVLGERGSHVEEEPAEGFAADFTTKINTPLSVWRSIASGEVAGDEALMRHMYSVEGDFDLMIHWDEFFGAANAGAAGSAGNTAAGADSAGSTGAAARGENAMTSAIMGVLSVCGWMTLTSVIGGLLPEAAQPYIEVSRGCFLAAQARNATLAAFLCGFGGICAGLQNRARLTLSGVDTRWFFPAKALCGGLCAGIYRLTERLRLPAMPETFAPYRAACVCAAALAVLALLLGIGKFTGHRRGTAQDESETK